ncbi:patatin-1-Kuras 2-like [Prosopis cineraria]|uniref:patatin-1-Kuras 2-like n=1 Tax=Prosopis cineraria TaxID=364024 RepID=UPI00240EAEA9|nr:patatin-1-Kuras 2-like [Prosopis cineraria]
MSKIAVFLLLTFLFTDQLMAAFAIVEEDSEPEKVRVLAIDGGGIKGIVPGVILKQLEIALQIRDPSARIAEYFDVVAGTSTGGIITAILTAPDPQNKDRPLYPADEILKFYRQHGPFIFQEDSGCRWPGVLCPKFNGTYLRRIAAEKLDETLLNQTTTNVVISSFDIKLLQPTIFSSFKIKDVPHLNVKLSDACIGTSAAPNEFPPYYFEYNNTEFNLVDGLFIASMPARLGISEVSRQEEYKNKEIILLSIGTGVGNTTVSYDANRIWTAGDWKEAILPMFIAASSTMNEYYINSTFKLQPQENYLRIQEYNLDPSIESDDASEANMDKLEDVGNKLLDQPVKRMNVDTFVPEEIGEGTNAEALDRLAQILYEEKIRRHGKSAKKVKKGFFTRSATYWI